MHCLSSRACYMSTSSYKNTDVIAGIVAYLCIPSCLICNSRVGDIWVEWLFYTKTSLLLLRDKENGSGLSSKQVRKEGKCTCSCSLKFKCGSTGQEPKECVFFFSLRAVVCAQVKTAGTSGTDVRREGRLSEMRLSRM